MNRFLFLILFLLPFLNFRVFGAEKSESESPQLVWEVSEKDMYPGEFSVLNLVLYSNTAEIAYAEAVDNFGLKNGSFGVLSRFKGRNRIERVKYRNKECLKVVLASYIFNIEKHGTFTLSGGEYIVGLNYQFVVNDAFWGPVSKYRTKEFRLTPPDLKIKIKSLPTPAPDNFSGAIGSYSVETLILDRQIIVGERAHALIRLRGNGYLPENVMPVYKEAFGKGVKLLSASDSRRSGIENGKVISILEIECEFLVESGEGSEIGTVSFSFFDPDSGKYVVAESHPVKLNIVSSVVKRDLIEI